MIKTFRIIAFIEGVSYLVLLVNMFLIKPNFIEIYQAILFPFGMAHGALFVAYVALAFLSYKRLNWNPKILAIVLLASIIPFGTFYIEKKYLVE